MTASEHGVRLNLTTEFQLLNRSRAVDVPHGVQRVLALIALAGQPMQRSRIAGQLWPDVPEWRALGNLRSALWRLRPAGREVTRLVGDRVALDPQVVVDVDSLTQLAECLLDEPDDAGLRRLPELVAAVEILPDWEEDWLDHHREHYRELRLRALERACEATIARRDTRHGLQACLAAVEAEPFRESAQRLLVRMHLSEGNRAAALRAYLAFRDLVERELGIEPSDQMDELVVGLRRPSGMRLSGAR